MVRSLGDAASFVKGVATSVTKGAKAIKDGKSIKDSASDVANDVSFQADLHAGSSKAYTYDISNEKGDTESYAAKCKLPLSDENAFEKLDITDKNKGFETDNMMFTDADIISNRYDTTPGALVSEKGDIYTPDPNGDFKITGKINGGKDFVNANYQKVRSLPLAQVDKLKGDIREFKMNQAARAYAADKAKVSAPPAGETLPTRLEDPQLFIGGNVNNRYPAGTRILSAKPDPSPFNNSIIISYMDPSGNQHDGINLHITGAAKAYIGDVRSTGDQSVAVRISGRESTSSDNEITFKLVND